MSADAPAPPAPLVIVGAGRAGRGIAAAAHAAGLDATLVDRERVVAGDAPSRADAIARAATLLVAVQDAQLDAALAALAPAIAAAPRVVLQVSGSAEPAARAALVRDGHAYGTFHPLLPLADPAVSAARFRGAVVGVEGDAPAHAAAVALATRLGAVTIAIPRADRASYHAAAVLASNFPVTLAALAEAVLHRIGVDGAEAHRAVRVLMAASVDNLTAAERALDALTGPLVRGDAATVRAHVAALAGDPVTHDAYRTLGAATLALLAARGTPSAVEPSVLDA